MKLRNIILIGVGLVVITGGIIALNYSMSTKSYTVNMTHTSKVEVIDVKDGSTSVIATVRNSGDTIRVSNEGSYAIRYTGESGYANGLYTIAKDDTVISVDPDYSSERYNELIAKELPAVQQAISERYPTVYDIFTIERGAMRQKGTWFTAQLTYKGEYSQTADNLRVLLKFEDSQWKLVTQPEILLTSINYPRLPVDVLSWANSAL